jgi:hypothetical protein
MTMITEAVSLLRQLGYESDSTPTGLLAMAAQVGEYAERATKAAADLTELTGSAVRAIEAGKDSVSPGSRFVQTVGEYQVAVAKYEEALRGLRRTIELVKTINQDA